jgi:hypothetical protein
MRWQGNAVPPASMWTDSVDLFLAEPARDLRTGLNLLGFVPRDGSFSFGGGGAVLNEWA